MIDLHCHILPGVDDGSPDAEISLSMARHAAESGVTAIAVTPHCNLPGFRRNYRGPDYRRQLNDLRELLTQENIPLRLYSGAEVFADPSNIRTLIEQHELITLGGSRYLLVEFDFGLPGSVLLRTLEAIAQRGLVPVVAHPERYDAVQRDPGLAAWCFSRGMLLQLNKGSLLGLLGVGRLAVPTGLVFHERHAAALDGVGHENMRAAVGGELGGVLPLHKRAGRFQLGAFAVVCLSK